MPQETYRELYFAQLAELDAVNVEADLVSMAAGAEPILLCYESVKDIAAGKTYCHRHMVAEWFKTTIGLIVPEIGSGGHG